VDYDYDPAVDFSTIHTFGWLERDPDLSVQELTLRRIQHAVNAQLQAKGLTPKADNPDFLISIRVSGRTRDAGSVGAGASIGIPIGGGVISLGGGRSTAMEKREGTLVLDFVSPTDRALLWHGSATGTIFPEAPPEAQEERINQAVEKMLATFPPQREK
jgi:hypothetical protein